jgi:hypothetical protein
MTGTQASDLPSTELSALQAQHYRRCDSSHGFIRGSARWVFAGPSAARSTDPSRCSAYTSARTRLAEIDAEIADLEARLKCLTVERRPIARAPNAIVYLILTLPPEITAEIFILYVALDEWVDLRDSASGPSSWRAFAGHGAVLR